MPLGHISFTAPYIKEQGGGCGRPGRGHARRSPTPTRSRTPPFPSWNRIREKERERRRRKEGAGPLALNQFSLGLGGPTLPLLPSISTKAHIGPLSSRGVPVTSRYSGKIPISPGTLPTSKHRLPIYQSSCLDHFETPRHVRDYIRDSEQPSVHQNI